MWEMVNLDDVVTFVRGLTYTKSDEVDFSNKIVLRANNVDLNTHCLVLDELKYIRDDFQISDDKYLKQDDILICTASGSKSHLGKVALIKNDLGMAFGGFMGVLRCIGNCQAAYLRLVLTSPLFISHLGLVSSGTNINNLKFSQIKDFKFPLPPFAEQQRIVAKLDAAFAQIDGVIEYSLQSKTELMNLFDVLIEKLITDPTEFSVPLTIGDLLDQVITGPFGSALHQSDYTSTGTAVINPQNLANGEIVFSADKFINDTKKHELSRYEIKVGDLLMARRGEMGRCALVERINEPMVCGTGCMILRAKNNVDKPFLYELLASKYVKNALTKGAVGATMLNLNQKILLNIPVAVRGLVEQQNSVKVISSYRAELKKMIGLKDEKIQLLQALKLSLLRQELQG